MAPDDFDEQQLAEAKHHASSPGPLFPRLGERKLHELRQSAVFARSWLAAQMEHARQRFDDWIERTDVTAEESADNIGSFGAASAFRHRQGRRRARHEPEELRRDVAGKGRAQIRRAAHHVGVAVWNDEDVASLQPHRRGTAKRGPASATSDDVIGHDVFGSWEHDRRKFRRRRYLVYPGGSHLHRKEQPTSEPGCPQDIGQNIDVAVFRCCHQRTRVTGLRNRSFCASPGCWGRQRGRSVMVFGHRAILYSPCLRCEETGRTQMVTVNASARAMWASGDYHRFATATVWELGPVLVAACGVSAGQRVLDVAAGTGNVAIRAAQTGASVVASDVTLENFDAGRRAARTAGVDLEWIEGDAQALPFADDEFDVVTSCFGVMFAPDHEAAASELLRVCRPGGVIGLINFTPDGAGGDFFRVLSAFAPPAPSAAPSPLLWGTEDHVKNLFGERVQALEMTRHEYCETAMSSRVYFELFRDSFGPMVAIHAGLCDQAARSAELDAAFMKFIARWNRGTSEGQVRIPYEYLLVVAHKLGASMS